MGLDKQRFSDEVDEDFSCPICHDIVEDPIASRCEHVFCKKCINQWLQKAPVCPVDKKYLYPSKLRETSTYFRKLYSKFVLKCVFESNGCGKSLKIEDLDVHQNECKFNPIVESECEKGCEASLMGNQWIRHDCVEYLKHIHHKYEQDIGIIIERNSQLLVINSNLQKELSIKDTETIRLKHIIESQSLQIENAKKRESENEEFVRYFESMQSSQNKEIREFKTVKITQERLQKNKLYFNKE